MCRGFEWCGRLVAVMENFSRDFQKKILSTNFEVNDFWPCSTPHLMIRPVFQLKAEGETTEDLFSWCLVHNSGQLTQLNIELCCKESLWWNIYEFIWNIKTSGTIRISFACTSKSIEKKESNTCSTFASCLSFKTFDGNLTSLTSKLRRETLCVKENFCEWKDLRSVP